VTVFQGFLSGNGQTSTSVEPVLALDATNIYFGSDVGVMTLPKVGGTPTAIPGTTLPTAMAFDSTNVYWYFASSGVVMSAPKDGGTLITVVSSPVSVGDAPIAVDDTNLYYSTQTGLMSVPKGGGGIPVKLASNIANGVVVNGTTIYLLIYGVSSIVASVPVDGGTVTTLASFSNQGQQVMPGCPVLAIDSTNAYWVFESAAGSGKVAGSGTIMTVPLDGGAATTLVSGTAVGVSPYCVAVDSSSVYWTAQVFDPSTQSSPGAVMKVSK
jgi:hypothetical protein